MLLGRRRGGMERPTSTAGCHGNSMAITKTGVSLKASFLLLMPTYSVVFWSLHDLHREAKAGALIAH